MTQIADQLKLRVRGLVGLQSNRVEGSLNPSSSCDNISVISKPAVLHDKASTDAQSIDRKNHPGLKIPSDQKLNAEELQMLAKIEEQNRLLEADGKSLKSVSSEGPNASALSRRSSNGSASPTSVSMHSVTSAGNDINTNGTHQEYNDKTWNLWGRIVNDWEEYKKKNGKQLKEIIRCGIPHHFRGLVWQLLCSAHNSPHRVEYRNLLKQPSPSEKLIRRDIARTYPEQDFFKEKDGNGQEVLFNVIKAYSLFDREVGYCQGSAFIVGLLVMQMPEEESFAVFVELMNAYRLRELFKPSMAELGLCMYQLENMLQDQAADLLAHFQAQAFHTSMFASSWFLTLFATYFNITLASRILDVFLSEGMEIIFRIGMALLLSSKTRLLSLDMEGMLKLIQKELSDYYNKEPDLLFQKAYALVKYNGKKMKKLEKDYMNMKEREQEEQVEMRRLRTENRLLRQRIEVLEKENAGLADKLIQDRVNRALEAEEKIIMGKELSIAKRQAMLRSAPSSIDDSDCVENGSKTSAEKHDLPADCRDEFSAHVQQELVQSKMREAESASKIIALQEDVCDLRERNRELTDQSKVTSLQDELIATKLREAEASTANKELAHKIRLLEENWQKHLNRTTASRRASIHSKSNHSSKMALQELQEELMSAKVRETKLIAQHADTKQKLMEIETTNHIHTSQLRRSEEERCNLTEKMRVCLDNERVLKEELSEAKTTIAHVESKNQEALMSLRIREADNAMKMAELEQVITSLKLKKIEELPASQSSSDIPSPSKDSARIIHQLQSKVLQQQRELDRLRRTAPPAVGLLPPDVVDSASDFDDDDDLLFDATLTSDVGTPDDVSATDQSVDTTNVTSLDSEMDRTS